MIRRPARRAVIAGAAALAAYPLSAAPGRLSFSDLAGWAAADHEAGLAAFRKTVSLIRPGPLDRAEDWSEIRAAIVSPGAARRFFERHFEPVAVAPDALFTAYYEPEIAGSRTPDEVHRHPIRTAPRGSGLLAYSRGDIMEGALDGLGLELFWLADPIEAFFLHVQGSGRIRLPDGAVARVGFAGRNAHPYKSIGAALKRNGLSREAASAGGIRRWLRENPVKAPGLLKGNPSYIFFEERRGLRPEDGPLGAIGASLTAMVSAAVDPAHHPLGAPLWVEAREEGFGGRLMVAQDVGAAIKGPGRADLFIGAGLEAGRRAGRIRTEGRLVTLLPRAAIARLRT